MIGLLASKTVDSLEIGKPPRKKKSIFAESDSENEILNLLPSNRKQKQMVTPKLNGVDQINIGPRCRAFVAFLVMLTLVGMVMLVSMAALGEFKEKLKTDGFHPIVQQGKDQETNLNSERDSVESARDYRLPISVTPQRYVLSLNVDTERLTFTGHVVITVLCRISTHTIILHSSKHTINSTRVSTSDHREDIILKSVKMDPEKEFLILHLAEPILVGKKYEINIGFNGTISNEPRGFYRMKHVSNKGEDSNFFTTNLEPVYARTFFPCFDEPAMRSKFKVKVTHSDTWKSSSTMPVSRSVIDKNGLREVEFQETPSIPPYLLSLVICNMRRTGLVSKQGISINTFSPVTEKKLTSFANGAVDKAIQRIERESRIKFPLPKVDIFLMDRRDFSQRNAFGQIILPIIEVGEPLQKFRFLQSLAEQLAKFWFQGIVGMKWWSDGWLMRSLAAHISHHAVLRHMEPGLNIDHFFYMEYTNPALKRDQDITRPGAISLNDVLNSTKSIEKSFNSCYEKKGASLIRMARVLFGRKMFYKTVQSFLKRYHGKTVSIQEFFQSFPKHRKSLNMSLFMKSWVQEPGYPYVRLKYSKRRHKCYFAQSRFSSIRHQTREKIISSPVWQIPLTINLPKRRTRLLRMTRRTVTFHLPTNFGWLKANVAQKGLYRVNYDSLMWQKIIREFSRSNSSFGELDRAGIIDDAFLLARAGKLTFRIPLDLTSHLRDEKSFVVWRIALEHFEYLLKLFHGHKQINCVKKYLFGQAMHMTNSVGWLNQGSLLERMLRDKILSFAVEVGDRRTIAESKKLFERVITSKERLNLPYGLKCLVFKTAIAFGDKKEWNAVVELYKSKFSKDKRLYLSAIASSKSTAAIESFLVNSAKFGNTSSELSSIIKELSVRPIKQSFAWKLIKNNWDLHSLSKDQLGEIVGRLVEGMKPGKVAKSALDMLSKHKELKHLHQKVENELRHAINHVTQIERWLLTGKHGVKCH